MKQALLWSSAIAIAASLLVASDYRSWDPDSSLYAYFIIGTVGVVAAIRSNAGVRGLAERAACYSWLPVTLWFVTFLLSLGT